MEEVTGFGSEKRSVVVAEIFPVFFPYFDFICEASSSI
jgi:hypothetical protein